MINNLDLTHAFDLGLIDYRTLITIDKFCHRMGIKVADHEVINLYTVETLLYLVEAKKISGAGTKTAECLKKYLHHRYNTL